MVVKINKGVYEIALAADPCVSGPDGVFLDLLEQEVRFARDDYRESMGEFPYFLKSKLLSALGSKGVEITIEERDTFQGIPDKPEKDYGRMLEEAEAIHSGKKSTE